MVRSGTTGRVNPSSGWREANGEAGARRWLGVEFRHLGALAAVAREGSFRRAAESLGYVQSAISGQIAHLERVIGTQLVERSSGTAGATLTPEGRVLLGHVEEILARFEAARMDVGALADDTSEVVRVGVPESVAPARLAPVLREFANLSPDARVEIHEAYSAEEHLERLAGGELDVVLTELPLPDGPFDHIVLERDPYVLLAPPGSPLAHRASISGPDQLVGIQVLIAAPARPGDPLAASLTEGGVDLHPSLRPRSFVALQALVATGTGVAIVPALATDPDDGSATVVAAPGIVPERVVVLVKHRVREYSATVQQLIELVRAAFAEGHPAT